MIKRSGELTPEVKPGLRGGKGSVLVTPLIEGDQFHGKGRLFAKMVLQPGCSIGLHAHTDDAETYYILSGSGALDDNGTLTTVAAGDVVFTGNGASHAIENTGTDDLVFVALILFA
jgi:mannose-6-phosphate isomerase-like protein (cupin superfamily)